MFETINGYYTPVSEPFTAPSQNPISLTEPNNIFFMQDRITKSINDFETSYSRYLRCQDLTSAPNVTPPCDTNGADSFNHLNNVYHSLLESIQHLDHALDKQSNLDAITPEQYSENIGTIQTEYANILVLREKLDRQLQTLNEDRENASYTPARLLESAAFANTLWVILASCLVYYVIVNL